MSNPHTESGSQDYFSIYRQQVSLRYDHLLLYMLSSVAVHKSQGSVYCTVSDAFLLITGVKRVTFFSYYSLSVNLNHPGYSPHFSLKFRSTELRLNWYLYICFLHRFAVAKWKSQEISSWNTENTFCSEVCFKLKLNLKTRLLGIDKAKPTTIKKKKNTDSDHSYRYRFIYTPHTYSQWQNYHWDLNHHLKPFLRCTIFIYIFYVSTKSLYFYTFLV